MSSRHEKKRTTMAANLQAATGKSVAEWVADVDAAQLDGYAAIINWLKRHHGLGHFQARLVAEAHRER
jgi:hypothetical protein